LRPLISFSFLSSSQILAKELWVNDCAVFGMRPSSVATILEDLKLLVGIEIEEQSFSN